MCLFQSFSKKIGLTMTVDVAQGIECCCILNDCMRITLFSDHLLDNQLQRIFDNTHGETQKIESVKTRTSKSSHSNANKMGEQLSDFHDSNICHRKLRNQSFSLHQGPAIFWKNIISPSEQGTQPANKTIVVPATRVYCYVRAASSR